MHIRVLRAAIRVHGNHSHMISDVMELAARTSPPLAPQ